MNETARLVVILGPTASGKSALALWLAERLDGEIVSCDSTQVYRHFDIGTAKASPAARSHVPHHLLDLVEPHELFTAGEYRRRALEVLEDLRQRVRMPVLTVGTGLYLRALLEGLADAPARSEKLRARLRARASGHGAAHLHGILKRLDPQAASRIAAGDSQKVIRAIEIRLLAGKTVGEVHRAGRSRLEGFKVYKIGLLPARAELYARIERRVETMLEAGWLEEVRKLVARGMPATSKPFGFIGYAQLRAQLEGNLQPFEAVEQIQRATRRYAKRQLTWFRKEPGVRWLPGFGDAEEIQATALGYLQGETGARWLSIRKRIDRSQAGE